MHTVVGDRIFDAGKEVMWRGAGASYLLHSSTLPVALNAWATLHIPRMLNYGHNIARLAFSFSWDTYPDAGADKLDTAGITSPNLADMDALIKLLGDNGIKSILDYHGSQAQMFVENTTPVDPITGEEMFSTVNPALLDSWQTIANRYRNNENVVAYELYNEPATSYGGWYVHSARDNAHGYNVITNTIRALDPDHIVIWETPPYTPQFEQIQDLMLPNVVYTSHKWWSNKEQEITTYGAEELSRMEVQEFINWRTKHNIPIWLGEFGGPSGGPNLIPYDPNNLQWRIAEELIYRCEEQVFGYTFWMGTVTPTMDRLSEYVPLYPLKISNPALVRQPWIAPKVKTMSDYIIASNGIDFLEPYELEMWHNGDSVTFKAGITLQIVVTDRTVATGEVITTQKIITVSEDTKITIIEGSGIDQNITIYSIAPSNNNAVFLLLLAVIGILSIRKL